MSVPRALPGNANAERRTHLREYLLGCMRDNTLTLADFADGLTGMRRAIVGDVRKVAAAQIGHLVGEKISSDGRLAHLQAYLHACIRHGLLSQADMAGAGALGRVYEAASGDAQAVIVELGLNGGKNILRLIGAKIFSVADGLGTKRVDDKAARDVGAKLMELGRGR